MSTTLTDAVHKGCRAGAVVPGEAVPGPKDTAKANIGSQLGSSSFYGIDCTSADDERCEIAVDIEGTPPTSLLTCKATMEYPGITGVLPMPESVSSSTVQLLEMQ